jgi:hypothetical protein
MTDTEPDRPTRTAKTKTPAVGTLGFRLPDGAAAVAMALVVGALLVFLSMPRILAELNLIPANGLLDEIRSAENARVDDEQAGSLGDAIGGLRRATSFVGNNGRVYTDLALAKLREMDRAGAGTEEGRALLDAAISDMQQGLALSPANSFAWARLSYALLLRDGATDAVLDALRMSYQMAGLNDKILFFRTDLSLGLWKELDKDLKDATVRQIAFYWESRWRDRKQLMWLGCRHDAIFVINLAVRDLEKGREDFDRLYPIFMTERGCRKLDREAWE